MKKVIILKHGGGELANQLWNYISIYAYCLEKNYGCENPSFFEHARFFNIPPIKNKVLYWLFFPLFHNYVGRRSSPRVRFFRALYKIYILWVHATRRDSIVSSGNTTNTPFYLPPTKPVEQSFSMTEKNNGVLYFEGWFFRNPEGIKKYRTDIVHYFSPKEHIRDKTISIITPLRKRFNHIVGVHIRQGDYATFKDGKYLLRASRAYEILKEYLERENKNPENTAFVITSDGPINSEDFPGLTIHITHGNAVEDLFVLSVTDVIIGSNSSFGNLAGYIGNIPHIVMTKEPMDWGYYRGKNYYFPTKYCTMVHY